MNTRRSSAKFLLVLLLGLALSGVLGLAPPARASMEDAALFYEELAQHGHWVEYENYGPVWYPQGVEEGWRPYLDGRWNPTAQGYVFETQEPWGWATYHYGNWMPTESYGWVWVPGRTWYPNTVNWRISEDYVGWAPVPPPDYVPPPAYAPPGGYSPGMVVLELLTAPFYIFAKAASFLLGFGQPYSPAYSYLNSGILAPPSYVPVVYSRTVIVNHYVVPNYYPPGYLVRGSGVYAWGPPPAYVSRVARIHRTVIDQHLRTVRLTNIHHGLPDDALLTRRPFLRQIVPPALVVGKPLPRAEWLQNPGLAKANLNRPNAVPGLKEVPRLTASLPKAQAIRYEPDRGMPGMSLPPRAVQPLTPEMSKQIDQIPPEKGIAPWSSRQLGAAAPVAGPGALATPPLVQGAAPEPKPVPSRVAPREAGKSGAALGQEPRERQPRRQEMQPRPQEPQPRRQAQWQWPRRQGEVQPQRQQQVQQPRQQEMQPRQGHWRQQQAPRCQELPQRHRQWQQRQQEMAQRRQQERQHRQPQVQQSRQERQPPQERKKPPEQQPPQQQTRL